MHMQHRQHLIRHCLIHAWYVWECLYPSWNSQFEALPQCYTRCCSVFAALCAAMLFQGYTLVAVWR
jgi:hypothetical protein